MQIQGRCTQMKIKMFQFFCKYFCVSVCIMILLTTTLPFINVGLKVILKGNTQFKNMFPSVSVLQLPSSSFITLPPVLTFLGYSNLTTSKYMRCLTTNMQSPLKQGNKANLFCCYLLFFAVIKKA